MNPLLPWIRFSVIGFSALLQAAEPGEVVPMDSTARVLVTASSEETGKNNFAWRAVDNDENTRWCASGPD